MVGEFALQRLQVDFPCTSNFYISACSLGKVQGCPEGALLREPLPVSTLGFLLPFFLLLSCLSFFFSRSLGPVKNRSAFWCCLLVLVSFSCYLRVASLLIWCCSLSSGGEALVPTLPVVTVFCRAPRQLRLHPKARERTWGWELHLFKSLRQTHFCKWTHPILFGAVG